MVPLSLALAPSQTLLTQNEPPAGEPSTYTVDLEPLVLSFFWQEAPATISLDRAELRELTGRHILEALQAELGLGVQRANLVFTSGIPKSNTWQETLTGNILFEFLDNTLYNAVQALVMQAFQGNALELYQFRLQIAQDPMLRQIQKVVVVAEGTNRGFFEGNVQEEPSSSEWSIMMIAIVASVAAALCAVCCFAYCLLVRKPSSSSSRADKKQLPQLGTNPTTSDPDVEQAPSRQTNDPEEEMDDQQSVGTSVYSYLNDDMSLSAAPSFLYSINETSRESGSPASNKEESSKSPAKKGLLWSVMMQDKDDDDDDEEEDILEADDQSYLNLNTNIVPDDSTVQTTTTPTVQKRFEALWKEDDALEKKMLARTVKKSNTHPSANVPAVYEDGSVQSGGNYSSYTRDDTSSVESPMTALSKVTRPNNVYNLPKETGRRTSDKGDDDNKFILPMGLQAMTSNPSDSLLDDNSVHSHNSRGSDRSVGSNRSTGSGRPRFEPSSGGEAESVRKKRTTRNWVSSDNISVKSQQSTDSAKFRYLLSQEDRNDANLFLNHSNASSSSASAIPATQLSYTSEPSVDNAGVTSLIRSFDKAWNAPNLLKPSPTNSALYVKEEEKKENSSFEGTDPNGLPYQDEDDDNQTTYTEYPGTNMASF